MGNRHRAASRWAGTWWAGSRGARGQGPGIGRGDPSGDRRVSAAPCLLSTAHRRLDAALCLVALLLGLPSANPCRAEDSTAQRRERIESMKPAEKRQLLQQHDRFVALKPEEQERLRELHRQLANAPDADQLRRVMRAYCEWLKLLPAYRRDELLDLKPDERIKRIQELRAEEAERPKTKDLEGLSRWMQEYAAKPEHQDELLKAIPKEGRPFIEMMKRPEARSWLALGAVRMQMSGPGRPDWLSDDELAGLRKGLSDDTRKRLESLPAAKQWETIGSWIRLSAERPFSSPRFRGGPPSKELQGQLDQFFENGLTPEQKEELLNLPGDEMQRRLEGMYFRQFWPMPGPGRGPRRAGPPGSERDHSRGPERGPRGDGPGQDEHPRQR